MVEADIRISATQGGIMIPAQAKPPAARGWRRRCSRRPIEVLEHLAVAGVGEPDDTEHAARIAGRQHNARRFDGDVGACADRESDVGAGECGGVVHAVADHGDGEATSLQLDHGLVLVFGEHLGEDLVDAELRGDGVGDLAGIAGDHHDADAESLEVLDRRACFGANLVLDREGADDVVVTYEVEH